MLGFIGLGKMGMPMSIRLLEAGHQVIAFNRTRSKLEPFTIKGGTAADSIAHVSRAADVVFTSLSMPEDVEAVYFGKEGILANSRDGLVCVDLTTVGMDTSMKVSKAAADKGIYYLDAPVSGGPEGAEAATLTIMVGGDESAFAKAAPFLTIMGQNVQHVGPSGLGSAAKLLNQYLVAAHTIAAAEVMVSGEKIGLDQKQLYNLLRTSYGFSRMLERHMEQFVFPDNFNPGGALKYVLKDVRLSNMLVAGTGIEPAAGKAAQNAFAKASEAGWGEMDMSALFCWLRE